MNLRDDYHEHHKNDMVRIKSCGAIFRKLHNDTRVILSPEIKNNIFGKEKDLRKETGHIVQIFEHPGLTNKTRVYVIKITSTKEKGYILIGKTGIKKLGDVTVGVKNEGN